MVNKYTWKTSTLVVVMELRKAIIIFTVVTLVILLLALLGDVWLRSEGDNKAQMPTPVAPSELSVLPRDAQIKCDNPPRAEWDDVAIWELPGVEPGDPNSAYMGNRGKRLGLLRGCISVTVMSYAWSQTDRAFWVHIKGPSGEEGWVLLKLLVFND